MMESIAMNENYGNKIYFDHNATTPVLAQSAADMISYTNIPLNPSSLHSNGRLARGLVEGARARIKDAAGADNNFELVFTCSGTEANNFALRGVGLPVITTATEHSSVLNLVGAGVIPVNRDGVVELDKLESILKQLKSPVLVSVMMANNETGVIQPIAEIAKLTKQYGCLLHTDAVQAFCKIPFDISALGVDLVTLSGHKFGGPIGAACLLFKKSIELEAMMIGGGQEHKLRAGTENVPAIHAFGTASELASERLTRYEKIKVLRDYLEDRIRSICPEVIIFGENVSRIPNTSTFTMPNVQNETQLIHFDLNGIAVSAGSACGSRRLDYPRVLVGMGYDSSVATTSVRVSLGRNNTKEEIDYFVSKWEELYNSHNKNNKELQNLK